MTWFRVDDGLADHPKVLALLEEKHGDAALGLWTVCGSWAAKQESDGFVPAVVVRSKKGDPRKVSLLIKHGLWEEVEGGYQFHDWAQSNPTKADLIARREQTRQRVSKHRDQRVSNALPERDQRVGTGTLPVPTLPVPTQENPPIPPGGGELVELRDADREALRPSVGGAYLAEVREAWAEAWHAAGAGTPPRLAPALMAGAVAFARDVATTHKLPLRDAARAVAEAALRAGGDPTWHLTRLDPFAAPRPLPGAGNGMPLADQIQAAEKALREAGVRDAPMSELQPLADRVKKLKAQRDEREDQARRYARR